MVPPDSSPPRDDSGQAPAWFPDWRDPPGNSPDGADCKTLTLVHEVDGQIRVRWRRMRFFWAFFAGGSMFWAAIYFGCVGTRDLSGLAFTAAVPACVVCAYLVLLIEVQTQRLRSGQWRFRFSMRAIVLWTAIVAVFLALATRAFRDRRLARLENQRLESELEAVVNGGNVSIDMPWGYSISCQVTRSTFSDDDLARIIELASQGGTRTCDLSSLWLAGTNVTNAGVSRLSACEQLQFLEVPAIDLNDEAIDSLARLRRLETLMMDERQLTARQLDRLREALPDVRVNGQTWQQRQRSPLIGPK